jgi:hypothetical protein
LTQTVTRVATITDSAGATKVTSSVGLATVAQAVSGDVTSTSFVVAAAEQTGTGAGAAKSTSTGAAAGRNEAVVGVKVMAVMLGGVVVVAGLL